MVDKRDLSSLFRERLKMLVRRSDLNQSAFAAAVGIDRSALSQLLSGATTRLPRAETLLNIASENKVSLDWLLGLSQDEGLTGEIRASFELEEASGGFDRTLLARWHAEAAGTKIRYVPAGIPDLLRTDGADRIRGRHHQQEPRIAGRRDALPHRLFAPAGDRHGGLHAAPHAGDLCARPRRLGRVSGQRQRAEQLAHMSRLLDDLYPTFRLFLYDGRMRYSVPYTIFGSIRAAIYVGDMYLVLNATRRCRR